MNMYEQAGAELGQAQLKLGFGFASVNNERFEHNQSVTWVEVGVRDYIISEHLVKPDNQGDAALWMGYSDASQRFIPNLISLFQKLVNGIQRYHYPTMV